MGCECNVGVPACKVAKGLPYALETTANKRNLIRVASADKKLKLKINEKPRNDLHFRFVFEVCTFCDRSRVCKVFSRWQHHHHHPIPMMATK